MEKINLLNQIKKFHLLKFHLIGQFKESGELLALVDELLKSDEELHDIAQKIKNAIKQDNYIKALNILNHKRNIVSNSLYKTRCSKYWYDLVETGKYSVRFCPDCKKNVYLVSNNEDLEKRKTLEQNIAFDILEYKPDVENDKNYKSCHLEFEEDYEMSIPA